MSNEAECLSRLQEISKQAPFNLWLGLDVVAANVGEVELRLPFRTEFAQYSGFLHAAIIAGLIDTACGFAAATLFPSVIASQFSVRCLRPAIAEVFVVRGRVLKAGRQQIFATAELTGMDQPDKPFAVGDTMLVPTH